MYVLCGKHNISFTLYGKWCEAAPEVCDGKILPMNYVNFKNNPLNCISMLFNQFDGYIWIMSLQKVPGTFYKFKTFVT